MEIFDFRKPVTWRHVLMVWFLISLALLFVFNFDANAQEPNLIQDESAQTPVKSTIVEDGCSIYVGQMVTYEGHFELVVDVDSNCTLTTYLGGYGLPGNGFPTREPAEVQITSLTCPIVDQLGWTIELGGRQQDSLVFQGELVGLEVDQSIGDCQYVISIGGVDIFFTRVELLASLYRSYNAPWCEVPLGEYEMESKKYPASIVVTGTYFDHITRNCWVEDSRGVRTRLEVFVRGLIGPWHNFSEEETTTNFEFEDVSFSMVGPQARIGFGTMGFVSNTWYVCWNPVGCDGPVEEQHFAQVSGGSIHPELLPDVFQEYVQMHFDGAKVVIVTP